MKNYPSKFRDALNVNLMTKADDLPLIEYIKDSWKSLEVVPQIHIDHFEYSEHESDIDINKFIFKREKKKKKKERFDYKYIQDNRIGKLTTFFTVTLKEKDEEGKEFQHVYSMKKAILVPLQDEDGCYFLKGKKYYSIYQLVEKSTYTSSSCVTLKSLMPVAVKRGIISAKSLNITNITDEAVSTDEIDVISMDGKEFNIPFYNIFVFKKEIPLILFYLTLGIEPCLSFLNVENVIEIIPSLPPELENGYLYFQMSTKCYIRVIEKIFLKYSFVQSVVGGLLNVTTNRVTIDSLNDTRIWIKKISGTNNYEKGCDILNFFERLLDVTTKRILKIEDYHKKNIYTVLRWMMQEYTDLRLKDNLDLKNKRLRCNELPSALLTQEFSSRLNRIISLGEKATIDNFRELFHFPGDR